MFNVCFLSAYNCGWILLEIFCTGLQTHQYLTIIGVLHQYLIWQSQRKTNLLSVAEHKADTD